ncbi:hypothetical protein Nwi_1890 [Nitrobacter winogradskyi Nb-255]|uniref:Uncharacterized protein n=1 Tax=Nitrobacter winogradskyi (strain ATCC 25391 / DSM 10237 / CIP 104748 / NCIMB 11846 / Nb-255) TaxID=323098 RepID=Q3SRE1_NITWN|nr:hypothetical protein [Nitrobacter winogradskyi]ABA05150.1 hypothetical protein Nwi_1890 [Nitrobacter winogradskyi Nb-255]
MLDLSFVPTSSLPLLLISAFILMGVAWRRGVTAFKQKYPVYWVLAGGVAFAIAVATAVEFWLVRA